MADMRVSVAGLELRSPVVLAAGTAGYLDELEGPVRLGPAGGTGGGGGVGAICTKSITRLPREGNETWRILPARKGGMLNAIGLANVGIERFAEHTGPRVAGFQKRTGVKVIGSVAGFSIEEYVQVCAQMELIEGLGAVELNVSCPNVHGGVEFGLDCGALRELVTAVKAALPTTGLIVKLSPVAVAAPRGDIVSIARAAIEAGAQALTLCNTMPAMAINVKTLPPTPRLANVTGGLSGPAVHPVAVRLVHLVHRGVARDAGVPIIGAGGVSTWEDAAEFVAAGATAVEMGTALFADPRSPARVARGLAKWVQRQGGQRVTDLVGAVKLG